MNGSFRATQGWQFDNVDGIFVLNRELFLGKKFLYSPEISFKDIQNFENFLASTRNIAKAKNAIFLKIDFFFLAMNAKILRIRHCERSEAIS